MKITSTVLTLLVLAAGCSALAAGCSAEESPGEVPGARPAGETPIVEDAGPPAVGVPVAAPDAAPATPVAKAPPTGGLPQVVYYVISEN